MNQGALEFATSNHVHQRSVNIVEKKQTELSDIASISSSDHALKTMVDIKPLNNELFLSYIAKRQTGQQISRCFDKVLTFSEE